MKRAGEGDREGDRSRGREIVEKGKINVKRIVAVHLHIKVAHQTEARAPVVLLVLVAINQNLRHEIIHITTN